MPVFNGDAVAVPTVELRLVVAGVYVDLEAISLLGVGFGQISRFTQTLVEAQVS